MTFVDARRSRNSCGAFLGCSMPPNAVDCQKLTRNTQKVREILQKALSLRIPGAYFGGLSC
jgi:hypothetical protein